MRMRTLKRMARHCGPVILCALAVALAYPQEQDIASSQGERNRRLFTNETFGGNGRTCDTCHSLQTGTLSPGTHKHVIEEIPSTLCSYLTGATMAGATARSAYRRMRQS